MIKFNKLFTKIKNISRKENTTKTNVMSDKKLFYIAAALLLLPLLLAFFGGDRFRYPCQDPDNWEKDICKMPRCDVTRTCPEHIFKGQRDPRLGPPPTRVETMSPTPPAPAQCVLPSQGANCGK